ncbi:MAG: glycosyltransferase family 25 protein [Methylotenera sp.]|nr:glycosyltransferase family 25 protein [Methylotenera sp.]
MTQTVTANAMDYFDKIFIINLPFRADRRLEMAQQLQNIGLNFDSPNVELFPAIRPESADGFPTIGTRGCFMSHLGVLRNAKLAGYNRILVFEDDLDFVPDFNLRIAETLSHLKQHAWSVFYGGYELLNAKEKSNEIIDTIDSSKAIMTCHFMAIQGNAIAELVDYFEVMLRRPPGAVDGGPMHVDGAYSWFRRAHPDHITFIAQPELGHQRSSRTDIHDLNWYDRVVIVRDVVQWLRKIKRKLLN